MEHHPAKKPGGALRPAGLFPYLTQKGGPLWTCVI